MKQLLLGMLLGMALVATVSAAVPPREKLRDVAVQMANDSPFVIPPEYGHLVSVVNKGEVHYLYFEAADGTIRVVLVGTRGALQQARTELQLLTTDTYVLPRHLDETPTASP